MKPSGGTPSVKIAIRKGVGLPFALSLPTSPAGQSAPASALLEAQCGALRLK